MPDGGRGTGLPIDDEALAAVLDEFAAAPRCATDHRLPAGSRHRHSCDEVTMREPDGSPSGSLLL